jgi:hypothetical protein
MFAMFILVLFYKYDRVSTSLWIRYPGILLGEGYNWYHMLADYFVAKKHQQAFLVPLPGKPINSFYMLGKQDTTSKYY